MSLGRNGGRRSLLVKNLFSFERKIFNLPKSSTKKHGGKTIFFARFIPFIRTFAPVVAGVAEMPYNKFALYNISGGIVWVVSLSLVGFYLGKKVEHIDQYVLPFLGIIIVLSFFAPLFTPLLKKILRRK
jgi:membrane-associated protein